MRLRRTRRTLTGAVVATGLALSLVACSSDDDSDSSSSASASDSSAASEDSFPTTVSTKFGNVEIKEQPKKVVALGWGDAETAMALGVQPIAESDWLNVGGEGLGPWVDKGYDKAPEKISTSEPEYEKIASLDPDIILDTKSKGDQERYDKLSAIAPTVGLPDDAASSFLTGPDDQVKMIAQALGKTDEGDKILKDRQDRADKIKADHPDWEGKTLSAIGASKTWGVFLPGSVRVDPLMQLGFKLNDKISSEKPGANGFSVSLTDETLADADADLVLAYPISKTEDDIKNSEAWNRLPAVKDGHAEILPKDVAQAFSMGTPQAYDFAMDKMVPIIEEHVAK
jgi:iron complex transport system substrate-binding protein